MLGSKNKLIGVLVVTGLFTFATLLGGCTSKSRPGMSTGTDRPRTTAPKTSDDGDAASTAPSSSSSPSTTEPIKPPNDVEKADQAAIRAARNNNPSLENLEVLSTKLVDDWAMVVLQEESIGAASFLMKKQGANWVAVDFGTSIIPEDHPDAPPELFL